MSDIRHYHAILNDALNHAIGVALRAQEATEGTQATLLFNDIRKALHDFKDSSPAMNALTRYRADEFERRQRK